MRLIIYIFLAQALVSFVHASEYIDMRVSGEEITLGESIQVDINVNATEIPLDSVEFSIPGLENFDIFSQSQSESYSNVNGKVQREMVYSLSIYPISIGDFTLGPVRLISKNTQVEDDSEIIISVGETTPVTTQIHPISNSQATKTANSGGNTADIRGLRIPGFPWWGIAAFIVGFVILFYTLLQKIFLKKEEELIQEIPKVQPREDINSQLKTYFSTLKNEIGNISSKDFFRKYNTGIRRKLITEGYRIAETATLKDLERQKCLESNIVFHILKKSYKYEYNNMSVSHNTQQKYIDDILKTFSSGV